MKAFVPAVVALVVGIILGAWQPRGELLEARKEMDQLRASARSGDCRGGRAMDGIRDILRTRAPEEVAASEDRPAGIRMKAVNGDEDRVADENATAAPPEPEAEPPSAEDIRKNVAMMQATLDARRSQALAALTEQGDLSDDQVDAVDAVMNEMNAKLKDEVNDFVAAANAGEDPDRRDMMEFAANTLDAVIIADDKLREIIPADIYDTLDAEAVDPFSYISGDAVPGLADLKELPDLE